MSVSRLAASGLLLVSLLALALDGKPVEQWPPRPPIPPPQQQSWPAPKVPPLQQKWLGPPMPPPPPRRKWQRPLQPGVPSLMEPQQLSAGGTTALRQELSPRAEAASGPAAAGGGGGGGGSKAAVALPKPPKAKGAAAAAATSRLMRDLRTDGKQAPQKWGRLADRDDHPHPHPHPPGGGGGGGGGSRRLKALAKKGAAKGCFGLKLDRIGTRSGLGC